MENNMLIISTELAQALHDYLSTRPMREVEALVNGLRRLPVLKEPEPKKAEETE